MENKIGRASKKNILLYSFGGIGSNTAFWFVLMYASYFFIDILGIDPLQVGLLLLIPRFIDAFTDPLMGMIADKTKTKKQ